ncbi:NUDIX hydrolase [Bacillus canaveralius]|uniref:NUDIX hydrolase n=1 Tax=Bacillus canaveralius TaxID=1403243 RepID=A0A2N5GLL3_9BACI|nr:NUDIX domain-containing protein [Bacillus canaveralius]PLR82524.1 NUDIX hydrolase [Bacillus canaveralius]PLR95695.1 NUDIX hydrolase [Bacillus canaveralius]
MENEKLKIFDKDRNQVGVATREEVHRVGHWHEAFHCWFISREEEVDYIYLQLRSDLKKDYPNLLDITAAGHLLAHETVHDGIREIKEEIGIDVSVNELVPLGIIDYCVIKENFIDKEIANVFLYESNNAFDEFTLQKEEVSGIVRAEFDDFNELWLGEKEEIRIKGFEINKDGEKILIDKFVGRNKFVPHENSFYESVIQLIKEKIKDIKLL